MMDPMPCTRCGGCCEELPCGLAPVVNGRCTVYGKRKGVATCYIAQSEFVRAMLGIGEGCMGPGPPPGKQRRRRPATKAAEKAGQLAMKLEAANG